MHLPTHTGDRYNSSVAIQRKVKIAKSAEWEFKEKYQLQVTKERDKVFSKVGLVKNVEEWHNFGLIMVFIYFGFEMNVL